MKEKKCFILLASVFLALFLAVLLGISLMRSHLQTRSYDIRRSEIDAFHAAQAGVETAILMLRRDEDWNGGFWDIDNDGDVDGTSASNPAPLVWGQPPNTQTYGFFWIDPNPHPPDNKSDIIRPGDGTVWLRVYGMDNHPDPAKRHTRVIFAQIRTTNPAQFFTSTLGDLRVGSSANIGGDIMARDIAFDVDSSLTPPDNEIHVNGDVLYTRNISGQTDPDVYISGSVTNIDPVAFASVDLQRYTDLAQNQGGVYISGNYTISGDIDWGTLGTSNGLVFVDGDVTIKGAVKESMLIVASGDILIDGDIQCVPDPTTLIEPQIGLFAANDVIIKDQGPAQLDINIDAFIFADGGLFTAQGQKGSKNTLNFEGAIAARGSTDPSVRTAVDLNVYNKRIYHYDQELANNRTIPFISFNADIKDWQEPKSVAEISNFPPP